MWRKILAMWAAAGLLASLGWWLWPRPRPHVLLITLDTTRADRLGCYGYSEARTPVLDSLAARGLLCERAYTVAPLTLPAHASLFTGLYPAETGVRSNGRGRLDDGLPTLAEVLRREGYDTGAFVASFVLDGKFGLARGFQTYDDDFAGDEPSVDVLHRQRHGAAVVDAALQWLGAPRSRPFFCWVHLYDPHYPYVAHEDLFGAVFADRPYDGEIAYVDRQVGRLVEFLKIRGVESQTVVVVAGDHGEGLGEHVERQHGSTLYNATMRVPLILCHPGVLPPGGRLNENVSLVDLSPTVLALAGAVDRRKVTGRSFEAELHGKGEPVGGLNGSWPSSRACYGATDEPFLNNGWSPLRCLIEGDWKYIKTTRVELYNLADDPREEKNLAETEPDQRREMADRLEAFESRLSARGESRVALSARERQALASLGYAGGRNSPPSGAPSAELPDVKDMLPYDIAVEDAAELVAKGSLDAAIVSLREVIDKAPRHIAAYGILAQAHQKKSEFNAAADVFLRLLDTSPESREGYFGLGHVLVAQGRPDLAVVRFKKAVEIDPDFASGHYSLAAALAKIGRPDEALAHFGFALENDPRYAAAYRGRANVLANLGQISAAIADWNKSLEFEPDCCEAHHHLGIVLSDHHKPEEARQHLMRAVKLCPGDPQMHYALGEFLLQHGDGEEAIRHLSKALELKPGYAAAENGLRKARETLNQGNPKAE